MLASDSVSGLAVPVLDFARLVYPLAISIIFMVGLVSLPAEAFGAGRVCPFPALKLRRRVN
jgi:hypothetical protein